MVCDMIFIISNLKTLKRLDCGEGERERDDWDCRACLQQQGRSCSACLQQMRSPRPQFLLPKQRRFGRQCCQLSNKAMLLPFSHKILLDTSFYLMLHKLENVCSCIILIEQFSSFFPSIILFKQMHIFAMNSSRKSVCCVQQSNFTKYDCKVIYLLKKR